MAKMHVGKSFTCFRLRAPSGQQTYGGCSDTGSLHRYADQQRTDAFTCNKLTHYASAIACTAMPCSCPQLQPQCAFPRCLCAHLCCLLRLLHVLCGRERNLDVQDSRSYTVGRRLGRTNRLELTIVITMACAPPTW